MPHTNWFHLCMKLFRSIFNFISVYKIIELLISEVDAMIAVKPITKTKPKPSLCLQNAIFYLLQFVSTHTAHYTVLLCIACIFVHCGGINYD